MQKRIFNLNLIFLFSFLFYTNLNSLSYAQFLAPEYPTGTQQQYTLPSFPQNIPTYSPPAYTAPQIPTYMLPLPPPEPTTTTTTTSPSLIPSSPLEEQPTALEPTESQPEQETITTSEPSPQEETIIQPEPLPSEETKVFQEPSPVLPESASNTASQVLVTIFSSNCSNSDCSGCNSEVVITQRIGSAYENCCRAKSDGTGCN